MRDQHLYKSLAMDIELRLCSLQITIILIDYALKIFSQSRIEKWLTWLGIQLTTFDLSSQSGAWDHSAMVTPCYILFC